MTKMRGCPLTVTTSLFGYVTRSAVHRTALMLASNGCSPISAGLKLKSEYVTQTYVVPFWTPTNIHSLSRKWNASDSATSRRVGQHAGFDGATLVSQVESVAGSL